MADYTEHEHGNISIRGSQQRIDELLGRTWDGQCSADDFSNGNLVLREDVVPTAYGHALEERQLDNEQEAARDLIDLIVLDDYVDMALDAVFDESETPSGLPRVDYQQKKLLRTEARQYSFDSDEELVGYAEGQDALVVTTNEAFNEQYGDRVTTVPPSAAVAGYKLAAARENGFDTLEAAVGNGTVKEY